MGFDAAGYHVCQDQTVYPVAATTTTTNDDGDDICGSPTDACMNEQNYQKCMDLKKQGCESILNLLSCPAQFECGGPEVDRASLSSSSTMNKLIANFVVIAAAWGF